MDAITYLKEKSRLTQGCEIECINCRIGYDTIGISCEELEEQNPEKAVEIIEQWSKDCPTETYMDKVLAVLPSAKTGMLNGNLCLQDMFNIEVDCNNIESCEECWKQPYKEQ